MAGDFKRAFFRAARIAAAISCFGVYAWAQTDPPARVARLSYMNGAVSMEPNGTEDWVPAVINRPFTTGDYVWADTDAHAELQLDNSVVRLNNGTSMGFLALDDRTVQIKLGDGEVQVRLNQLGTGEVYEVDTPNAAVVFPGPGIYRIKVSAERQTTDIIVRRGEADVTGGGQTFRVPAGQIANVSGTDQLSYSLMSAPAPDAFERFCEQRDANEARAAEAAQYVPPGVVGYEDLDMYGAWRSVPAYGWVWYPRVAVGWAPYRVGHWAWIPPWGWTWIDDAPWGFAPFHYGRWAFAGGGWCWIPGPRVVRPVYAPALVAWIGGTNFSFTFAAGSRPGVAWVPLGPGEIYTPGYRISPTYFQRVNVTNTVIQRNVNITNVYNNYYVNNRTVTNNITRVNEHFTNVAAPGAVTAMPRNDFAAGRPVARLGQPVRPEEALRIARANAIVAPAVAPERTAIAPTANGRLVPKPPARVVATPVVTRTGPVAARSAPLQTGPSPNTPRPPMPQANHPVPQPARPAPPPVPRPAPAYPAPQAEPQPQPPAAAQPAPRPVNPRVARPAPEAWPPAANPRPPQAAHPSPPAPNPQPRMREQHQPEERREVRPAPMPRPAPQARPPEGRQHSERPPARGRSEERR